MKILVPVKKTPHRDSKVRIAGDGKSLSLDGLKFEVNPFDELAVEEALRIKEKVGAEVVVATVGDESCQQQLLAALAMGADRAIRVDAAGEFDGLQVARCLLAVARRESPDLILSGKLAVDDENGQVPSMLAELLGWPQANQASKLVLEAGGKRLRVTCEVDAGLEEIEIELPAVVTADLRLNEPRYASLPGIMKAKKKPQEVVSLKELGDIGSARARVAAYRALPPKPAGIRVGSVEELVKVLSEKKLI
jgi:electron transfer flavoprotein beta subunit